MSKYEKMHKIPSVSGGKTAKRFCKEVLFASFSFKKRKKQNTAHFVAENTAREGDNEWNNQLYSVALNLQLSAVAAVHGIGVSLRFTLMSH